MRRLNRTPTLIALALLGAIATVALFGRSLGIPEDAREGALALLGGLGTLLMGALRAFLRDALSEDDCET